MRAVLTQVEQWRAKAGELRGIADALDNAMACDQLLQMAEGYERLANKMEELEIRRNLRTVGLRVCGAPVISSRASGGLGVK